MLSIGSFSKISGITTNALRYYDEIGLIKPALVNHENGYRYYAADQLKTILLVNKLKAYQLSLEEIGKIIQNPDDSSLLLATMKEKRAGIRDAMEHLSHTLKQLDQDIFNLERGISIMSNLEKIQVQLVETKNQNILFVRAMMSTKDYGLHLSHLTQKISQDQLTVAGPPLTVHHVDGQEFNPECYDNEIAIPVAEAAAGTRILPGGLCAMVRLCGPYTELPAVYTKLQQWLEKENYVISSEPYEAYVTDPHKTAPEENITEVYFPVGKHS